MRPSGIIGLFVRHPNAANLLMAALILLGAFSLTKLNKQFFPDIEIPKINVSIAWPGASAEDVEKNVINLLEPELRFLDNVEDMFSYAREGNGTISIEFNSKANMQKALSDVEAAVGRVTTLPDRSERPVISRITFFDSVASLIIHGPYSEAELKRYAKQIRDGLLDEGIERVDLEGTRDEEIWVEVGQSILRRLDLTVRDIADRFGQQSQDIPSGILEGEVDLQVRSKGLAETVETVGAIEVRSRANGEKIFMRDIATIEERFDREASQLLRNGEAAIRLDVRRAVTADTITVAETMRRYIDRIEPTLPADLKIEKYRVRSDRLTQRINLLLNNGLQGLVIVLIVLFIFLNARIAFWVAFGIPVAVMGTLAVMWATGQSINMISLFALILTLGIIVDDAIVVGEHTATLQSRGVDPYEAAERGALRMLAPVTAATLTTQAAFLPLILVQGRLGQFMIALPLVVVAVLIASLIESFLILPAHLRHTKAEKSKEWRLRRAFDSGFAAFRDNYFSRFAELCFNWRYTTVSVAIGLFILSVGFIAAGKVQFRFFPAPEAEIIYADIEFAAGTPRVQSKTSLKQIEDALRLVERRMAKKDERLVQATYTTLGVSGTLRGDNVARINVQLTPSEVRTVRTRPILRAWQRMAPKIPGVERITISARRGGPPGRDVDVQLIGATPAVLKQAALETRELIRPFPGVSGVSDDLPFGKQEIIIGLTSKGSALGFTTEIIGQQVRNALEGAIAKKFARADEEITVRVKEKNARGGMKILRELYLRSPAGLEVPLVEVASLRETAGFSIIQHRDGKPTVSVTADVDPRVSSGPQILEKLGETALPELAKKYGIQYRFKGRTEERQKSFADLTIGLWIALGLIYLILAWVLGNYTKPVIVMLIIPFGVVGAIFGHIIMGFPLTILSLFGLLGLSGILVNDSIILVIQINEHLEKGADLATAAIAGARDRLRAVLLTSLTTIGGLTPLLFEQSRQAQFLLPMAVTLVFGLAVATALVLILVPACLGIQNDLATLKNRIGRGLFARIEPSGGAKQ